MTLIRYVLFALLALLLFAALSALLINLWVVYSTRTMVFDDLESLPKRDVALVLGTARSPDGKRINDYFYQRLSAAYQLHKARKVRHFILSGDNHKERYNEPKDMKNLLMEFGVPEARITLDYAGFRTLDSVVRSKKIFGQNRICIVSQGFHTPRALFIARYYEIDAVAYNAAVNENSEKHRRLLFREYLARVKAFLDIYILDTQPRFLGEKEEIDF